MSPAAPINHPWRFFYTLMWKEAGPIVMSTTPTAALSLANEARAPSNNWLSEKNSLPFLPVIYQRWGKAVALRQLSGRGSQHTTTAFPASTGSFCPTCPLLRAWERQLSSLEAISSGGTFLPSPASFPGGLGCLCVLSRVQLWDPVGCSPPGSSVPGSQARILEWVAISSSRGSSWPKDRTHVSFISCTSKRVLYH